MSFWRLHIARVLSPEKSYQLSGAILEDDPFWSIIGFASRKRPPAGAILSRSTLSMSIAAGLL